MRRFRLVPGAFLGVELRGISLALVQGTWFDSSVDVVDSGGSSLVVVVQSTEDWERDDAAGFGG